jgi:Domain of unknown function (DUF4337)
MAELEIHHEHEGGEQDQMGKKIGILASLLAVFLAIVTIMAHRAHTDAVLHKADANDKWAYYQSKRIKFHNIELGQDIAAMLGAKDEESRQRVERFHKEHERYAKESEEAQKEAKDLEAEVATLEVQALRYDVGEGLIEIGLVLSSLYFIARRTLFPIVGVVAGAAGIIVAASGLLIH